MAVHEAEIRSMEARIRSLDTAIAKSVSSENRAGAYVKLMKRKTLERKLTRTRGLCEMCRNTLDSIRQSDDMCVTMDALDAANEFVKEALVTTTNNLDTVDDISETFNDLQQTSREVHEAIGSGFDNSVDHDELEIELDRMFETNEAKTASPHITRPAVQSMPLSAVSESGKSQDNSNFVEEKSEFPAVPSSLPVSNRVEM